jgi:hypothetical protein
MCPRVMRLRKLPAVWGCRDGGATQLLLGAVGACGQQVVETSRPQRDCLRHGDNRVCFARSPGRAL